MEVGYQLQIFALISGNEVRRRWMMGQNIQHRQTIVHTATSWDHMS
jgi:hypothetical protein